MPRKYGRAKRRVMRYKKRMPLTKSQVKAVRKIASKAGELKYTDESFSSTNLYAGNGLSVALSGIPQGDGNSNREGDSLNLHKLSIRAMLSAEGTTPALIRCYAIQQLSGTAPTSISNIAPDEFFPTMDVADEPYKVLYDRVISVNPNGTEKKLFKLNVRNWGAKVQNYEKGTSTISKGKITLYFVPDDSVSTGNNIEVDGNLRLRYSD